MGQLSAKLKGDKEKSFVSCTNTYYRHDSTDMRKDLKVSFALEVESHKPLDDVCLSFPVLTTWNEN